MTVGIEDRNVDLDSRFELRTTGDPIGPVTRIEYWNGSAWVDLNQRYLPIANGSPLGFDVGYEFWNGSAWVDLSQVFAGNGTGYQVASPWNGGDYRSDWQEGGGGSTAIAKLNFHINSDGTFTVDDTGSQALPNPLNNTSPSGESWLLNGTASDFEVRATVTQDSGGTLSITNEMTGWVNAGTTRDLVLQVSDNFGTNEAGGTVFIEIRLASNGTVVTSGTLDFSVRAEGTL